MVQIMQRTTFPFSCLCATRIDIVVAGQYSLDRLAFGSLEQKPCLGDITEGAKRERHAKYTLPSGNNSLGGGRPDAERLSTPLAGLQSPISLSEGQTLERSERVRSSLCLRQRS